MADKSGIPANLGPAALVKLGTFQQPVVDFVSRLNRINWLAAAGDRETWDSEVERVWNREDALSRAHASNQLSDSVFDALGRIGNAAGRQIVMEAAEEYWIAA